MTAQFMVQRYWLNFKRHSIFLLLAILVLVAVTTLICFVYPGPEAVATYVGLPVIQAMTGGIGDVQNPGLLIWLLLFFSSLGLTIFYPVVGIFFGVNILPFNEKEGKELILSTEKSLLWYFFENLLLIIILIPIAALPAYLIGAGFLLSSGMGGGDLLALTIASVLPIFFVYVVAMVTSLGCSIWSSPKTGYAFGGIFFFVSFTLNLLQQEIDFVKDFNLMSQIGSFEHAVAGTWNEEFILECLLLMVLLIILTVLFLYRTDYIETRSSYVETVGEEDNRGIRGIRGITAKFSFIRTPVESVLSRVGWKYPALRDQLQSTAGLILIYLLATSFLQVVVAIAYPGDESMALLFSEMVAVLDSPIVAAFMFGHAVTPTFGGFVILKIFTFHWLYYGPFLFIMTYNIIMRDSNAGYDEITWSMPRTRTRIIIQRTIAALIYLWIIVLANFVVLYTSEILLGMFADVTATDFGATISAFIFLGIGYSVFLALFVALASIPRPKYLLITLTGAFLIAIFIPVVWYLNQDLSWLLYLSPFYYFDVVGIMLNDILPEQLITETIAYGAVITVFFVSVIKFWIPKRDIA